jgi:hypothetical protein
VKPVQPRGREGVTSERLPELSRNDMLVSEGRILVPLLLGVADLHADGVGMAMYQMRPAVVGSERAAGQSAERLNFGREEGDSMNHSYECQIDALRKQNAFLLAERDRLKEENAELLLKGHTLTATGVSLLKQERDELLAMVKRLNVVPEASSAAAALVARIEGRKS